MKNIDEKIYYDILDENCNYIYFYGLKNIVK